MADMLAWLEAHRGIIDTCDIVAPTGQAVPEDAKTECYQCGKETVIQVTGGAPKKGKLGFRFLLGADTVTLCGQCLHRYLPNVYERFLGDLPCE